ncbi:DJ-1 family glyoxalase III [Candidatus Venteria ishoeyi]|uniref:Chaperone protein YajL n=1 Tax=Candidatus Venteria ishoeyi TaxID=1899563 RepID=A0A1H6FJP1_9GAMM|nr:DJ-1 family glyoxalase III [Candidatus Venteria ishoeyi]MDM8546756.1 DJ-1/PfpI family protein [Candidatus Venteria ishoeyi]SEH09255.1 Chaperone protein YajL [Candidatus Venteria ishoeyi]
MSKINVLVPLAQGCEELEAVTIIDLLRRAGIKVTTAGLDDKAVKASRGVVLIPDTTLDAVMDTAFDMVVLPGGLPGADFLNADPRIHQLLQAAIANHKTVAAICAAPKVLADAGLLQHKKATSYPGVLNKMGLSDTQYIDVPVVEDGQVITSRGPGTAMDFALTLIERLTDKITRDKVEAGLVRP